MIINQEFTAIDTTIKTTQHFQAVIKQKLASLNSTQNNTILKKNLHQIKISIYQIKTQFHSLKSTIPKKFTDFLPTEYHHFLIKQKNTQNQRSSQIPKPIETKQNISNKQSITPIKPMQNVKLSTNNKQNIHLSGIPKQTSSNLNHLINQRKFGQITIINNSNTETLRRNIYKQLEELKGIQKRQNTFRMVNYSNKSSRVVTSSTNKKVTSEPLNAPTLTDIKAKIIQAENIKIPLIPSSLVLQNSYKIDSLTKRLYCKNKHQYYVGEVQNELPSKKGILVKCCDKMPIFVQNGVEYYNGGFLNGKFHGFGTLIIKNGISFVGLFKDGVRQGEGSLYCGGKVEVGRWKNDRFVSNI